MTNTLLSEARLRYSCASEERWLELSWVARGADAPARFQEGQNKRIGHASGPACLAFPVGNGILARSRRQMYHACAFIVLCITCRIDRNRLLVIHLLAALIESIADRLLWEIVPHGLR